MDDKDKKILELILEEKSFSEIISTLQISYRNLLCSVKRLIEKGYDFKKILFSDGRIVLCQKGVYQEQLPKIVNINFDHEEEFRVLFIADLHIGSAKDRLDCVKKVCEYAVSNGINYIFNVGDFIENVYTTSKLRLETLEEQIDCIINEFPHDKRLVHLSLYGNHDYYYVDKGGIDVAKEIEKNRSDIISLGYGRGYTKFGKDHICLEHECPNRPGEIRGLSSIKFIGHSHMYKFYNEHKKAIYVPSLSDEFPSVYSKNPLKGFLDVTFYFNGNRLIEKLNVQHFVLHDDIFLASKSVVRLNRKR